MIPTVSIQGSKDLILYVKVENKLCKFLIDTGSSISLIKEGISRRAIKKTYVRARGVTGRNLLVKGEQNVKITIGDVTVLYNFVVVPHDDKFFNMYDGILGLDLLEYLGAVINLPLRHLRLNDSEIVSFDSGVTGTFSGCGSDQPTTREEGNCVEINRVWRVENVSEQYLPPLSEVLVNGHLTDRGDIPVPREVLVEPRELDIQGMRVARVLSTVSDENTVIIKILNCSKEPLVIQKGMLSGLGEEYRPEMFRSLMRGNVRIIDINCGIRKSNVLS